MEVDVTESATQYKQDIDSPASRNPSRGREGRRHVGVAAFAIAVGFAAACSSDEGSGPASSPASTASVITIEDFSYMMPPTVPAGVEITVKNSDGAEHSVTSDTAGLFDDHVEGSESTTLTAPTTPGTYPFHCTYHPDMHGVLIVE